MSNVNKQRDFYDSIKNIYCKHLNIDVVFNAKGFHHLFYEGDGTPRNKNEVQYRLKLLPLVIPVIKYAKESIFEEREAKEARKKDAQNKLIKYWALVAWVGKDESVQIKVVIRQVGNGQAHFWSVMRLRERRNKKHQPTS